jgi:hypothetical protein
MYSLDVHQMLVFLLLERSGAALAFWVCAEYGAATAAGRTSATNHWYFYSPHHVIKPDLVCCEWSAR